MERRLAEECSYWRTGSSVAPEVWFKKAKDKLVRTGARLVSDGILNCNGQTIFMVEFELDGVPYRIGWPVLAIGECTEKQGAQRLSYARRQAATAFYHDVNSVCVKAEFFGARAAFVAFEILPDKSTLAESPTGALPDRMKGLAGLLPGRTT